MWRGYIILVIGSASAPKHNSKVIIEVNPAGRISRGNFELWRWLLTEVKWYALPDVE